MSQAPVGLPSGWAWATLGDVTEPVDRRGPGGEGLFQYIDIGTVDNATKHIGGARVLAVDEAPSRARQNVRTGDVLVSMTRPNLNAVALVPDALDGAVASTGFHVLRAREVEPRWLFAAVRTPAFVAAMSAHVQGALYPAVRPADICEYQIPLPPIAEQRRIMANLEELLASSCAARVALDVVPTLLEQYRQGVLTAAFQGDLTADWREENPTLVGERRLVPFGALVSSLRGGTAVTSLKTRTRWPVLKSSAVRPGHVDLTDTSFLADQSPPSPDHLLEDGDLLITRLSGSIDYVGNAAIVRGLGGRRVAYPDRLFRARLVPGIDPEYVVAAFRVGALRAPLEAAAKSSAGHQRISISDVRQFSLPVVSLEEQQEIVRRLAVHLAAVERQLLNIGDMRARIDELERSVLARAFRGELVPQDPTDEPASVLLERVRSERVNAPASRPRRRTRARV